jgi:putative SOS response-associated peptidase YedK
MCGRYTLTVPGDALIEAFDLSSLPELRPRYNVAPTQEAPVVRAADDGGRRLDLLKWGLVPYWAEDPSIGNRMINARAETAADKPSFRTSFKKRRCLVAADGFYEWKKAEGGTKQPYFIHLRDGSPFAFAGLWDRWRRDDREILSFTILTTAPNELVRPLHDRMPVILPRGDYGLWLDPEVSDRQRLTALLEPYDPGAMEAYPVSRFVNAPANDGPRCIEALA